MASSRSEDLPAPTEAEIIHGTQSRAERVATYGTVQHRDPVTDKIVLNPRPSDDPNDPLNWKQSFKWYIAILVCLAMMACNYLAAGPTVQIVETTLDFYPDALANGPSGLVPAISKVAYFYTTTALFQGLANIFWIPLMNKYGRRPIYLISFGIYFGAALWASFTTSYRSFLASRIFIGIAAGAGEGIAPVTISDLFFLHERGTFMVMYTVALNLGVVGGIIIDGLISIANPWRVDYYVATALIGALWVLIFFTFPETAYHRVYDSPAALSEVEPIPGEKVDYLYLEKHGSPPPTTTSRRARESFAQSLRIYRGKFTDESLLAMMARPFILILLPPVLWASLVMAVTIGFLVAITSNFASAFATTYGFAAWQSGLCFIGGLLGALAGIFFGGSATDMVADYFTRRNGGVREPEMRLPSILISVVTGPLALILYGVGIQNSLHWIVPTLGLALLNFSVAQATNVSLVYTIDAFRPIAGEVTVTQVAFKSAFGFLLSFYTNPWIEQSGYAVAFGTMAAICGAVLLFCIPLYFFGAAIRRSTKNWPIMRFIIWHEDRDVD